MRQLREVELRLILAIELATTRCYKRKPAEKRYRLGEAAEERGGKVTEEGRIDAKHKKRTPHLKHVVNRRSTYTSLLDLDVCRGNSSPTQPLYAPCLPPFPHSYPPGRLRPRPVGAAALVRFPFTKHQR